MKAIKIIIITLSMLFTATSIFAKEDKKNNKDSEVTFKAAIDCHSCEQKIKKNIPYEKGIKNVVVDLNKKEIKIKYRNDKTDKETIKKSIEKLGYACEEIPNKESIANSK